MVRTTVQAQNLEHLHDALIYAFNARTKSQMRFVVVCHVAVCHIRVFVS
jgi:hypothetical protein